MPILNNGIGNTDYTDCNKKTETHFKFLHVRDTLAM